MQDQKRSEEQMALTLRAARINKGLSRQEAAKLLGVGVSTIGNYERGGSLR